MATKKKDWVVTTSGDRPLEDVAKDLTKSGFKVGQVLHPKLRKVKGVTDVSANVGADVGPPDSSDTW
jgi:hypothetical protein